MLHVCVRSPGREGAGRRTLGVIRLPAPYLGPRRTWASRGRGLRLCGLSGTRTRAGWGLVCPVSCGPSSATLPVCRVTRALSDGRFIVVAAVASGASREVVAAGPGAPGPALTGMPQPQSGPEGLTLHPDPHCMSQKARRKQPQRLFGRERPSRPGLLVSEEKAGTVTCGSRRKPRGRGPDPASGAIRKVTLLERAQLRRTGA